MEDKCPVWMSAVEAGKFAYKAEDRRVAKRASELNKYVMEKIYYAAYQGDTSCVLNIHATKEVFEDLMRAVRFGKILYPNLVTENDYHSLVKTFSEEHKAYLSVLYTLDDLRYKISLGHRCYHVDGYTESLYLKLDWG